MQITPNMTLLNKYAPGDRVWIVFNIGADIKINQFNLLGFVAQLPPDEKEIKYLYAYQVDGGGHEYGLNKSWAPEEVIFFDKKHAQKKAVQMVGDLLYEFRDECARMEQDYKENLAKNEKKFKEVMEQMNKRMGSINAKNLDIEPIEGEPVPEQENPETGIPVSDVPETQTDSQTETQSNQESDENKTEGTQDPNVGETNGSATEDPQLNDELPQAV